MAKRTYDDANEVIQRRSRRSRYAQQACSNCKRRKLKCSGPPICERCTEREEHCTFEKDEDSPGQNSTLDREQWVDQRLAHLQRQIDQLSQTFTSPRGRNPTSSLESDEIIPREVSPAYIGPTSAEFGLHDAISSIVPSDGRQPDDDSADPPKSVARREHRGVPLPFDIKVATDLINLYERSIGITYPFLDVIGLKKFAVKVFKDPLLQSLIGSNQALTKPLSWTVQRDIEVLKLVLATALVAEDDSSTVALRLVASAEKAIGLRINILQVDLKEIMIFITLSLFYFFVGNEVLAWRYLGLTARGCFEIGLHRRAIWNQSTSRFPGEVDRSWALKMWWTIYVLDRRWSFVTGLPLAFRDADLDPDLPLPEPLSPYFDCMIKHARLAEQVWDLAGNRAGGSRHVKPEDRATLSFKVERWLANIPPELQYNEGMVPNPEDLSQYELRLFLYLNAQHLKISIFRDVVLSFKRIQDNMTEAIELTFTAKKIVHVLQDLDRQSDVYQRRTKFYNTFLLSALATLFLAICHDSNSFGSSCRKEFYAAIDLLKSTDSSRSMSVRTRRLVQAIHNVSSKVYTSRMIHPNDGHQQSAAVEISGVYDLDPSIPVFEQFSEQPPISELSFDEVDFTEFASLLETVGGNALSVTTNADTLKNASTINSIQGQDLPLSSVETQLEDEPGQNSDLKETNWPTDTDLNMWKNDEYVTQLMADLL